MSNRIVSNSTFAVNNNLEQVVEVSGTVDINTASELDMNLTQVNGSSVSLGSTTSSASIPVVIASDQSSVPISTTTALGVDVEQFGGVSISQGQTTSSASIPVVLASDDSPSINIESVSGISLDFGQELMTASLPVVIASDQSTVDTNIANFGGSAIAQGQNVMTASLPVAIASDQSSLTVNTTAGSDLLVDLNKVGGVGVGLGSTTSSASIPVVIASDQGAVSVSMSNANNSGSEGNLNNASAITSGDFSSEVDTRQARNITITGNTTDTGGSAIEIYTSHTSAGTKYKLSYDIYPDSNGNFYENIQNVAANYIYLKYTANATSVTATALFN